MPIASAAALSATLVVNLEAAPFIAAFVMASLVAPFTPASAIALVAAACVAALSATLVVTPAAVAPFTPGILDTIGTSPIGVSKAEEIPPSFSPIQGPTHLVPAKLSPALNNALCKGLPSINEPTPEPRAANNGLPVKAPAIPRIVPAFFLRNFPTFLKTFFTGLNIFLKKLPIPAAGSPVTSFNGI